MNDELGNGPGPLDGYDPATSIRPRCPASSAGIIAEGIPEHVEAARIRNLCAGKGLNVSGVDCLIAACAITGHHGLFAVDDDFVGIAQHVPLTLYDDRG